MRPLIVSPFKPHLLISMLIFLLLCLMVFEEKLKGRLFILTVVSILFVVFVSAYAYEAREISAMAVEMYTKKNEKANEKK
ncbi:MAG: hypothetical protein QXW70_00080 [Candidatus Anstonellales archaeon]